MTEVRVLFDARPGSGDRPGVVQVAVVGKEDQEFLNLLRHAVGTSFSGALLVILDDTEPVPEYEWRSFAYIGEGTTLGEVSQFADGDPINVSTQAVGGSHFMSLLEWIGAGLTLREIVGWSLAKIQAHIYVRQRASARRWLRGGAVGALPLDLLQHVKAQREWDFSEARTVFGLDDGDLGSLFRAAEYAFVPENTWVEQDAE